jgi:hypothetical protein
MFADGQLAANLTCFLCHYPRNLITCTSLMVLPGATPSLPPIRSGMLRAASVPKDLVCWLRTSNPSDTRFRCLEDGRSVHSG